MLTYTAALSDGGAAVVADVRPGHADVHGHAGSGRQWARARDGDGE